MLAGLAALAAAGCAAPPSYRGLAVSSENGAEVWASGSGGRVWHDGRSAAQPGLQELDFRDIALLGPDQVVLMSAGPGAASRLLRRTAQGWVELARERDPAGFWDGIAFWDGQQGLLVGDPTDGRLTILRTEDGGRNWIRVGAERMPAPIAGEFAFAASGTSVCVAAAGHAWIATGGAAARVWRSADWGRSWSAAELPLPHGDSAGAFSIAMRDAQHGVVVGGDYARPEAGGVTAAWTEDGGARWQAAPVPPAGYRSCVAWMDGVWVCTGPGGTDLSRDGGRSWQPWLAEGYHVLAGGWAAGDRGRVQRLPRP